MTDSRSRVDEATVADALAHPVRLDLLGYLIAAGPATAADCARAVGDSPANCSYHLRLLAEAGLVEPATPVGRRKPWRATVTEFSEGPGLSPESVLSMLTASMQLDVSLAREHIRSRDRLPEQWRGVEAHGTFGLLVTPEELREVIDAVQALLRPLRAGVRTDAPDGATHAHFTFTALPRPTYMVDAPTEGHDNS